MRYQPQILEEIRARLPVSTVVGRKVRLKKAGREWKGLSPFNAEKTPSFFVNDQKGFYHCFSSGKHGDIFSFLIETEGVTFPESVERLASEAGVALPEPTRGDAVAEQRRQDLHEVLELAAQFFESALSGRGGAKARAYLESRAIAPGTQAEFRLGYAPPDRFACRDHLAGKGVSSEAMIEAGLLVAGEDVNVPFDRFRDRIMFPIADGRGRVVAFGGRAMGADVPAKYLNSPETPLFSKGRLLYNLHRAKGPAHERGTVVAVEGYVDVIALTAAGFPNVVAPLGTALTEDQLAALWRMADDPVLCFDGDKAGRRAAYRALDTALPHLVPGRSLRFALLPDGQDPDDLVRGEGPAAFEAVLKGARPPIDVLWSRETEARPTCTPDDLAVLDMRVREAARTIGDETLRRFYLGELRSRMAKLTGVAEPVWVGGRRRPFVPGARPPTRTGFLGQQVQVSATLSSNRTLAGARESPREATIVSLLIAHPSLLETEAEAFAELDFVGEACRRIQAVLIDFAACGEALDPTVLRARLGRAGLGDAADRIAGQVRDRWALQPHADFARVENTLRQALALHRKDRALHKQLRAAERALAEEGGEVDLSWLREVKDQIASLEGAEADLDDGASP